MDERDISKLATSLSDYHAAIEQEFDAASKADDPEAQLEVLKKKVAPELPSIMSSLIDVAKNSESDASRISASKFLLTFMFGKEAGSAGDDDNFGKLIQALTAEK